MNNNVTGNVDIDHSGGGNTNGLGSSYISLATFTTISSVTSLSYISTPSLTNRVSLLSPSDKSIGNIKFFQLPKEFYIVFMMGSVIYNF